MKHLKAFILFSLLFIAANSYAAYGGYATMRVFDCNKAVGLGGGYINSKIFIVYEDGKTEEVELLPFSEKNEIENLKTINATLNKLKQKGYFLIAQSTSGEQGSVVIDYTLLKQQ